MRSTSSRRSDPSTSRRMLRGSPTRRGGGARSCSSQTRPALVKTYGRASTGMSRSARATISSEWPRPYTAAVSLQLMRRSTALPSAAIESASSWLPQAKLHPPPPIAHAPKPTRVIRMRSEEHTSELQSQSNLVCRLLLEKKKNRDTQIRDSYQTHRRSRVRYAQRKGSSLCTH